MTAPRQSILQMAKQMAGDMPTLNFPPNLLAQIDAGRHLARDVIASIKEGGQSPELLVCFTTLALKAPGEIGRGYMRELSLALGRS
ncbi:hypothetical protein [Polaromonas sp.]|uniref:hypothetical protein n=1 Tax=Polaromonas sp. TaxID=1869339 RepID=UPI0032644923